MGLCAKCESEPKLPKGSYCRGCRVTLRKESQERIRRFENMDVIESIRTVVRKPRPCLKCGNDFNTIPSIRICGKCKNTKAYQVEGNPPAYRYRSGGSGYAED